MTFLHFANCAALAFGPVAVLFKALGVSERGGVRPFITGIAGFFISQLVKLILASIVFSSYDVNANTFNLSQEIAATILSALDVAGVWYFFARAGSAAQDVKLLAFGLGWAAANNLAQYGPGLWIEARSLQFSWEHIQNSLHANASTVLFLSFVYLVWLLTSQKKGESQTQPIVNAAIVLVVILDSVTKFLRVNQGIDEWVLIGFRAIWTLCIGLLTRMLYSAATAAPNK